ncbi:MAG: hypothetical protein H6739_15035 [Alphaproteobacteria bacterium]|nr:hypothetical protein [Alphaproteobacteria bacterium]
MPGCAPSWSELVSGGGDYTCALDDEQRLRCWGNPYILTGYDYEPAGIPHDLDASVHHLCGLDSDDHAWCRSQPFSFNLIQDNFDERPVLDTLCTGLNFICGIESGRTSVVCWGHGEEASGWLSAPAGSFEQLSCGLYHACALDEAGRPSCWDPTGALGGSIDYLGQLEAPDGPFLSLDAGVTHTCGIRTDGVVHCWGGYGHDFGVDAPGFRFEAVRAGFVDTCGLRTRDRVACWGAGDGSGTEWDFGQARPPDEKFVEVAVGRAHACGLTKHDELICWGDNTYGQLDIPSWWDR